MILWNHIPLFYYRDSTKIGNFSVTFSSMDSKKKNEINYSTISNIEYKFNQKKFIFSYSKY